MCVHSAVTWQTDTLGLQVWHWPPLSSSFTWAIATITVRELFNRTSYIAVLIFTC
jgi:hypothetical protein